jgi:tRNA threonylcarbamoyladenosine dehydratase
VSAHFQSINRLYGHGAADALAAAHVVVVGIGGVGSWSVEALARAGVGRITMIDGDEVCVSNTNRQLHALDGNFGRAKVAVMAERVRAINPACSVHALEQMLTQPTLAESIPSDASFVLDACDSLAIKVALIAYCKRNKLKVLTVGAAGGRADPSKIGVRDLSNTEQDKLLALVRSKLRDAHHFTRNPKRYFGVPAVFSLENVRYPSPDGGVCFNRLDKNAAESGKLDCDGGLGVAVWVTASFGFHAAGEICRRLIESAERTRSASASAPGSR